MTKGHRMRLDVTTARAHLTGRESVLFDTMGRGPLN